MNKQANEHVNKQTQERMDTWMNKPTEEQMIEQTLIQLPVNELIKMKPIWQQSKN